MCKRTAAPAATVTVAAGDLFVAKIKKEMETCNNYRNVMWKAGTKVAFAVRDSWVVAWIQYPTVPIQETYTFPARTTVVAWGTAVNVNDLAPNTINLLKKCLKTGYNECVVNAELAGHNDARL